MRYKSILWIVLLVLTLGLVLIMPRLRLSQSSLNSIESIPNSISQSPPSSQPAINSNMPSMNMGGTKSPTPVSSLPPAPMSSVTQMNGLVMPPGMIMTSDMSMEAMADMAAVDLTKIAYTAPVDARGDQTLTPKLENGVKVFNLDVSLIKWNILPNVQVAAYAFNRQVPGPRIRVTEGDHVRIVVKNNLPEPTTVHWHGMILPNNMDGPADVTQNPEY